ncbi:MAG: HNH endonuclease [Desulfarculus sp.]|nr:HNH endonuclease [Pseudomonadota bacterium]MBV1715493.1 HNH endonuclease [Desulfarculus sp.]MBU4573490.1 HNH endonuclease [Pseudomonadota bacterium]MBU4596452.1 HNH endonuclease [Pseudomonadota bacterium]MBV1737096.1 HNH endonuclease [Desulfarculus sp.]
MGFSPKARTKVLLWSDRHCCLCKKPCDTNIEVHHIVPEANGGSNRIENAIPLCFDCHGKVQNYNDYHPLGNKYKPEELKARREQVYEEFTRYLVPPIHYIVTQRIHDRENRQLPDVGFVISNLGNSLPVKATVKVSFVVPNQKIPLGGDYYSGKRLWHLNPSHTTSGHFSLPDSFKNYSEKITLKVNVSIEDQYERVHHNLPVGYTYLPADNDWFLEPSV